jgi:hypothetical protein
VDKDAEALERMIRACHQTIEDVRAGNTKLDEEALPRLEGLCVELEAKLSRMLAKHRQGHQSVRRPGR